MTQHNEKKSLSIWHANAFLVKGDSKRIIEFKMYIAVVWLFLHSNLKFTKQVTKLHYLQGTLKLLLEQDHEEQ